MLLCLTAGAVRAQDDLAGRLLEQGDRLFRDGKLEQARTAWSDVVARHPDSVAAPTALDRLGTALYPVETFALRGQVGASAILAARPFFERLATDYQTAVEAPHAAFKLGLMFSDPASPFHDADEAYGWFLSITTLYPGSQFIDRGLFGLATILIEQRQTRRALKPLARVLSEVPSSGIIDRARYVTAQALVRLGHFDAALRVFQALLDESPSSVLAATTKDQITHLLRLMQAATAGGPELYSRFGRVTPRLPSEWRLRSVSSLTSDPENNLVLTDTRTGVVHVLDERGEPLSRNEVRKAATAWADEGRVIVGAGGSVTDGGRSHSLVLGDGRTTVGDIGLVARDPQQGLIVWDRQTGSVLRFDREYVFDRQIVSDQTTRGDAVAVARDGTVYVLDTRARSVTVQPIAGRSRQVTLADENRLKKPDALAVDFVGNIIVLDRTNREVGVFAPDGHQLFHVASGRTPQDPFPDPALLAVNRRGEILIYDERHQAIVVLR